MHHPEAAAGVPPACASGGLIDTVDPELPVGRSSKRQRKIALDFTFLQAKQVRSGKSVKINRAVFQYTFHREKPGHRIEFEPVYQALIENIISRHAACDDLEHIIPVTANTVAINHLRQTCHMPREALRPIARMMPCADHHKNGQVQSQRAEVNERPCAFQNADALQTLQSSPAGILRQSHPLGEFALRQARFILKRIQDSYINFIVFFFHIDHMTQFLGYLSRNLGKIA